MRLLTAALALALFASGCISSDSEPTPSSQPELVLDEDRPDTSYSDVETGPAVEPDLDATTAAPPELVPGEWWRIRYENAINFELNDVVRVVADVNDEGYIFGMPHEGWLKEAISYHAPAFGDVNFDLSYNTHNRLFEPVRFPLVAGDTWDTTFAAQPYTAQVVHADDKTALIEFESIQAPASPTDPVMSLLGLLPGSSTMSLTYDATQHEVVRFESAIGTWEVIEHGYDFQGWVTVPRGEDTAIDYGTFGPVSDQHTPLERALTVDGGFNRMTMMHFVGTLNDAPAHAVARDVAPDGTEQVTEMTGSGFQVQFFEVKDPDGAWTVQDTVVGAAFTYHMGIAYFQYDIHLPDGGRRANHSHEVIR